MEQAEQGSMALTGSLTGGPSGQLVALVGGSLPGSMYCALGALLLPTTFMLRHEPSTLPTTLPVMCVCHQQFAAARTSPLHPPTVEKPQIKDLAAEQGLVHVPAAVVAGVEGRAPLN